jgi:hypothetical protein
VNGPTDAFDAGLRVARALEAYRVSYALGGALAYGQYGVPRATNDVDVNVFVEPAALDAVFEALRSVGVEVDGAAARRQIDEQGMFVGRWAGVRVDVFTPSISFSWEAERTRRSITIEGAPTWFLSAEALCVFKLLFNRPKDLVDLERLIAVQGEKLDAAYVRARVAEIVGANDGRIAAWDRLCAEHRPS